MRAAAGCVRVRLGQTIDRAGADDAEPRDRGVAMDLVVGAQRRDEHADFCRLPRL